LSTFKQYEHKPPDLIKERVDKDYSSVLRTALTSISRVNKTDVETLRTSIGSFSDIAKASTDRLQTLPGFGQVKVKKVKDAFEKPFRNNATSSLPAPPIPHSTSETGKSKGKEREASSRTTPEATTSRTRLPSPVWDIELDLDVDGGSPESGPPPVSREPRMAENTKIQNVNSESVLRNRSPSPMWDIELDLNGSDEDNQPDGFGAAALL